VAAELREIAAPDTALGFLALQALRPHYASEAALVHDVDELLRPEGYRLVGVFEDGTAHALAVAGFRVQHMLSRGRYLYVDDLSTLPEARRRGYARLILDWLDEEATRLGCERLHLDSAVRAERIDAHRLYFNAGLAIEAYHFAKRLDSG
jgi:GNAT superfamily N-acetyltransferase